MNTSSRGWLPALLAAAVLALVVFETTTALRSAGPWRPSRPGRRSVATDPYERLDRLIAASSRDDLPSTLRDPFGYGSAVASSDHPRVVVKPRPAVPPPPPQPVLTAVVSDADPQAVILLDGQSYTVRVGSTFAGYRVVGISLGQVVLESNGQQIVLHVASKGE